ncbi:hypothetical protein HK096_010510 [Nowakowskiella sp. JEL0078]|nr:hypothetical protein HK096_010510 [Nowakowskiella sp. JEL0078]
MTDPPTKTVSSSYELRRSAFIDLSGGSVRTIAGITGKVIEFPFDTVKVRLQTQPPALPGQKPVFRGAWDCLKKTIRSEGFNGLYKGLSPPLVGSVVENAFLFMCYGAALEMIQNLRGTSNQTITRSMPDVILAGMISGAGVSFVLTPIELVKCKLQVQDVGNLHLTSSTSNHRMYTGPLSVIRHTLREHGFQGMYRGHFGTFLRESGGGGAWFGVYEFMIRQFMISEKIKTKEGLKTWQVMTAGAFAGVAFNGILFPADVIKSRMQTDEEMAVSRNMTKSNAKIVRLGFIQVLKDLFAAEGIMGLYRGFGITIARSAPTSAVIFLTHEHVSRYLKDIL